MHMEANWSKPLRFDALDAIVQREFDALARHRPPMARRTEPEPERDAEPSADAFENQAPDDEESFIERTVDYLRKRPDADALLEAIRSHIHDDEGGTEESEPPTPLDDAPPTDERT